MPAGKRNGKTRQHKPTTAYCPSQDNLGVLTVHARYGQLLTESEQAAADVLTLFTGGVNFLRPHATVVPRDKQSSTSYKTAL